MKSRHLLLLATLFLALPATPASSQTPQTANTVTFSIPQEGEATIAINDSTGARVRNLFGDMHFTKGAHTIEWDGCDDSGKPVPPGDYRWVGLYRGDLGRTRRSGATAHDPRRVA